MRSVYFALGYKCMHKCICCPITTYDKMHSPLDLKAVLEEIDSWDKASYEDTGVILSGGEPTIHEDFYDIIRLLIERGIFVTLLTTSVTFSDKEAAEKLSGILKERKNRILVVSAVHSLDHKLHDSITGVEGSLDKTLAGIDNLLKEEIPVAIKHIMSRMTMKTMAETFSGLDALFPKNVQLHLCSMDYQGRCRKNIDKLFAGFMELKPYIEETLDIFDNARGAGGERTVSVYETPLCAVDPYYWKYYRYVNEKANRYISPSQKIDDRQTDSRKLSFGTEHPECIECDVKNMCPGVWRSSYEYGEETKDFIKPIKKIMNKC